VQPVTDFVRLTDLAESHPIHPNQTIMEYDLSELRDLIREDLNADGFRSLGTKKRPIAEAA
jgi:hypothetical protein